MVNQSSTKDHKGIEIWKFVIHRSWRKYVVCLPGSGRDVKAEGRQRECSRTCHTCLYLGPQVECFGVPSLSLDWSSQTKKRCSGKLPGASFLIGHKRKALGGRGEGFLKGQLGSHIRISGVTSHLPVTLFSRPCAKGWEVALPSVQGLLQSTWLHKMDAMAAILWSSLAKLSTQL